MNERPILESWKEIAAYLDRSVKTCQIWETKLGLPIHRLDGTPNARVFAYPAELDRWVNDKLHSPDIHAPGSVLVLRLKKKKIVLVAVALAGLAVAAGLIRHSFLRQRVVIPSSPLASVVFLPFDNLTGDETLESWRSALPELFYAKFLQSRVVSISQPWAALRKLGLNDALNYTPEDLKKISGSIRDVVHIVTGSLVNSDGDVILSLSLHDSKTGETIQSLRAISRGEKGLFAAVDELTKEIKLALNVPRRLISLDIDEKASHIVTGSSEALKYYCQGMRELRENDLDEAISRLEKATAIDTEFGEAYYQLFSAAHAVYLRSGNKTAKDDAIRYGHMAFASIDRINAWTRGDLINDYLLDLQGNYPSALAEYKKLRAIRSGDPIITLQLAQIYSVLEEYGKVFALLDNESAQQDSRNILLLANACVRTGRYGRGEELLDDYLGKNPKASPFFLHAREMCALSQGKFDEALAFNDRAMMGRNPNFIDDGRAPILITRDDFAGAEKELRRSLDQRNLSEVFEGFCHLSGLSLTQGKVGEALSLAGSAAEKAKGIYDWHYQKRSHFLLANLYRLSGNLAEALMESEKACPCYEEDDHFLNPETKAAIFNEYDDISCLPYFHQRALLTLEMGRIEEFDKQLAEIKRLIESSTCPKLMRAYYHLLGHRALRDKEFNIAVGHFWKALSLLSFSGAVGLWPYPSGQEYDIDSAQYYYSLAEAYYQAGRSWSALDLYRKIPPYWEQRIISGEIYARSFYRIAKIYDQAGRPPGTSGDQIRADKAAAAENYRKFLSLWRDADPVFAAEVEDARARLAALEAQ
jgi:tetratricopeptide (TPR) repeat protein